MKSFIISLSIAVCCISCGKQHKIEFPADREWGVVNINGDTIIPFCYDEIEAFSSSLFIAYRDTVCVLVDTLGQILTPLKYSKIKPQFVKFFPPDSVSTVKRDSIILVNGTDYSPPDKLMFAQETGVVINGVTWATRNVGTPKTFVANPEDFGMYYQWNSKVGWTAAGVPSDGTSTWNIAWNGNGATSWETTNNVCPAGWRIPTAVELESLGEGVWTTNPVNGRTFGSGANTIFLPQAGVLPYADGIFINEDGNYWSCNRDSEAGSYHYGFALNFTSLYADFGYFSVLGGALSVRCVKDDNTGINEVSIDIGNAIVTGYFDILGRKLTEEPTKGIYIIQYDNGKTKKMLK